MLPQGSPFHLRLITTASVTLSYQGPSFWPISLARSVTSTRLCSNSQGQLKPVAVTSGPDRVSATVVIRVSRLPTLTGS